MPTNNILPIEAYTHNRWFDLEMQHIFSATWAFAGLAEDVTQPGQYKCVKAGLNNLAIIMGQDNQLRAFHNQCRHKGIALLQAQGIAKKVLVCPYHDWSYNLKGELVSAPKMKTEFPNLDKSCHGLKPASVAIWRGMLWVHPKPNAPDITQWFSGITPHLGAHQPEQLSESAKDKVVEEINANWKIVVENYIDHYHLAQLHSGTLNTYDHANAEFGFVGPHFAFWEPLTKDYADQLSKKSPLPLIDHIPSEQLGASVPMLFPAIGLSETESSWSTFHIIPLAVDRTRVEIRTKVMPASSWEFAKQGMRSQQFWIDRLRPKSKDHDTEHPLGSADFLQEDIYVCEHQQKALQNPFFELGPSAIKGEQPIRDHQQIVLDYLKPHLTKQMKDDFLE